MSKLRKKIREKGRTASFALATGSAVVVRLQMLGPKKNQAKVRAALRREIADMLHAKGDRWFYLGRGTVEIEWSVVSLANVEMSHAPRTDSK